MAQVGGAVSSAAGTAAVVVEPVSRVVRSVEPILASLTRPVAGLADPLTGSVGGLVRPVLGTVAPGLPDLVAPVAADLPVVAPVAGGVGPVGRLPGTKPAGLIGWIHPADPVASSAGAAETLLPPGKFVPAAALSADVARPAVPRPACHGTAESGSHRAPASAPQAVSPAGAPGHTPPAPASPTPSDVGCGTGSPIPPAFLASDHGPRDFSVLTRVHEVFVPLSRPCEPGTGPG
ncbi:hypothetical protein DMA12_24895 [Amycolatopsis balhimycina DSM 5908]|uniref:Uncharacterized protein n=1 Tax=Amycolatopsis balhimycina DSM 5908 TaxID=1081091 RepID=A0A428WDV3_AMYBA|nr:hypothetical protein DMA12_24895 [Amycolatopsis balhimycina DSM 5908]